jgi:hypothetical protein
MTPCGGQPDSSWQREDIVTRNRYGILAGVIGSALGAWWWSRHRSSTSVPAADRGTVIFDNTPTASDLSEGVI